MAGCSWWACSTRCWSPAWASCSRPCSASSIGIARLSPNWLVARLGGGYVELIRNLPLLFQILFWYLAVLGTLPGPRQSFVARLAQIFLNNRGIIVPAPVLGAKARIYVAGRASLLGGRWRRIVRCAPVGRGARLGAHRARHFRRLWVGLGLVVGAAARCASSLLGFPIGFERPELRGFNFVGGVRLIPEFAGAPDRALDLHGGLHRGDRARGHSGGAARTDRGGAGARPAARADAAARSSCRRRCA